VENRMPENQNGGKRDDEKPQLKENGQKVTGENKARARK